MNSNYKQKILAFWGKAKKKTASLFFAFKKIFSFSKKTKDLNKVDLDKKLLLSLSKSKIPNWRQVKYIKTFLSKTEKNFLIFSFLLIGVGIALWGTGFYKKNVRISPVEGGSYIEGLIGSPKYINPLYSSVSDVDNDISALVFSSLFKRGSDGLPQKDLISEYEIGEDGKIYKIKLREDVYWHNGDKLTANDVFFTFNVIKNKQYGSPLRETFAGVDVAVIDDFNLEFSLTETYANFESLLTFGILPQKLWFQNTPETFTLTNLNLKPIGSGPYKFVKFLKDGSGHIKSYELEANSDYYGEGPLIEKIILKFYPNRQEAINALNNNSINGIAYLEEGDKKEVAATDSFNFHNLASPQVSGFFFNLTDYFLKNIEIRQALISSLNKETVVKEVYPNEKIADSPIHYKSLAYKNDLTAYDADSEKIAGFWEDAGLEKIEISQEDIKTAEEGINATTTEAEDLNLFEEQIKTGVGSWLFDEDEKKFLRLKITAIDNPKNAKLLQETQKNWEQAGIKINFELLPATQIPTVIAQKDFQILLYTQFIGYDGDVLAFWHSSQTGENGLNITGFTSKEADKLLEEGRTTLEKEERIEKYYQFQEIINREVPAIFLYYPSYIYPQTKEIKNFSIQNIYSPADRFADINTWYVKTGKKFISE